MAELAEKSCNLAEYPNQPTKPIYTYMSDPMNDYNVSHPLVQLGFVI